MGELVLARRHALDGAALPSCPGAAVTLSAPTGRWIFRGGFDAARVCGAAFGLDLPLGACQANASGGKAALWLGPDEWLLMSAPDAPPGAGLTQPHALTDISDRQLGLDIAGPAAVRLLASHIMLDLDARAGPGFGAPGTCARTLFGKAEIVLWRKEADLFQIEVWRSFAGYVAGLLEQACMDLRSST